jgi:hypothetical protein
MALKMDKVTAGKFYHAKRKWQEWTENHADLVAENGFARYAAREITNDIKLLVSIIEGKAPAEAVEPEEAAA